MTEITDTAADMRPAVRRFVLQWGEMGGRWGVNRSVSQIHALLYLSEKPLTADDIAAALAMARSNVSNSIRELEGWSLVRRVSVMGDRREYFEADADVWSIAARIAAGRKQREIDPAIATLTACVVEAENDPKLHAVARKRLADMLDFTRTTSAWFDQMSAVPRPGLMALIRMGAKIVNVLPKGKAR